MAEECNEYDYQGPFRLHQKLKQTKEKFPKNILILKQIEKDKKHGTKKEL